MSRAAQEKTVYKLFDSRTTTGTSGRIHLPSGRKTIHGYITGTGAVSFTVTWYGADEDTDPGVAVNVPVTIAGNDSATDGIELPADWPVWYATISAIAGVGAAATVTVSV